MSKYFIKSDSYNWFLMKEQVVQNGKNKGDEVHQIVGCYSSVEELKSKSVEKLLKVNGLQELEKTKKELIELLEGTNE
jgi:hypothetical protein